MSRPALEMTTEDDRIEALVARMDKLETALAKQRADEQAKLSTACALLRHELGGLVPTIGSALHRVEQLFFRTWPGVPITGGSSGSGGVVWLDNSRSLFARLPSSVAVRIVAIIGRRRDVAMLTCAAACFALPQPFLPGAAGLCAFGLARARDDASRAARCDGGVPDERLRLTFAGIDQTFDAVSERSGRFVGEDARSVLMVDGRRGLQLVGCCALQLAAPVSLEGSWTVSVWWLAPLGERQWHNLLDGCGDDFIAVTFRDGRLGNYQLDWYSEFDARALPPGWHHLVIVGDMAHGESRGTSYYVDGEEVARHDGEVSQGVVRSVGNRGDGRCEEAFMAMSELRIFAVAATKEQVAWLYRKPACNFNEWGT